MREFKKNKGGRPRKSTTQKAVDHMMRVMRKRARETGKHIDEVLIDLVYDDLATPRDRLAAIRCFKEYTMAKTSEQNIKVEKQVGPAVILPPLREDPALRIVKG